MLVQNTTPAGHHRCTLQGNPGKLFRCLDFSTFEVTAAAGRPTEEDLRLRQVQRNSVKNVISGQIAPRAQNSVPLSLHSGVPASGGAKSAPNIPGQLVSHFIRSYNPQLRAISTQRSVRTGGKCAVTEDGCDKHPTSPPPLFSYQ